MNHKKTLFTAMVLLLLFLTATAFGARGIRRNPAAGPRCALVIGNSAYRTSPLKNPVNDARDMAQNLTRLGFDVTLKTDAGNREMVEAIGEFGKKLRDGGVGLFYFAGHGVQVGGRNYLLPVDARIESESDVRFEAVDAGRVLGKMEDAGNKLNMVILDACRNNPYARSFRSAENGLAKMDAPAGTLVAYATSPGSVAADGDGRNGLYTSKLLRHMKQTGLKVEEVFKRVRIDVRKATKDRQTPWELSSLTGDFYFIPPDGESDPSGPKPDSATDSVVEPPPAESAAETPPPDQAGDILRQKVDMSRFTRSRSEGPALWLDKTGFTPDEKLTVHFIAPDSFSDSLYISIVLSGVIHGPERYIGSHNLTYQYLHKRTTGSLEFQAPKESAYYDVRMCSRGGTELAYATFTVGNPVLPPESRKPNVWLDRHDFLPNEEIEVHFTAPESLPDNAYIALLPSGVMHGPEKYFGSHTLAYEHLKKRVWGTVKFRTPGESGYYDARLSTTNNNGREVASVTFRVGNPPAPPEVKGPKVWTEGEGYYPGQEMSIHFTAPESFPDNAYVAVVPSGVAHGRQEDIGRHQLFYQHLNKRIWGKVKLTAPTQEGHYDARLCTSNNKGSEAASFSFTVGNPDPPPKTKGNSVWLDQKEYYPGQEMRVQFTASDAFPDNAYVAIVPSGVAHGSEKDVGKNLITYQHLGRRVWGTLVFNVPQNPGEYDARMCDTNNNGREVASMTFKVK